MAVLLEGTKERIGRAHIAVDQETDTGMIGWFLTPEHWGKGYATEITHALIDCCFDEFHLHRVNAVCHPENAASWRVLEKCGFVYEGTMRKDYLRFDGAVLDSCIYSVTKEEWLAKNS